MWYFQSATDEERRFLILPGKEYVIGRRDCDIVIENDQSVSRKHAILSVSHSETNVANINKPASLTLKDVSKFGTFVSNQKVKGQRILQDGDEVRFGTPKSVHRVVYEPFIVTTSCVDGAGKKDVRSLVCQIGGHVSNEWRRDCRYLVMKSVTVTVKVVCALLSLKPVVTVQFLHNLLSFYKGHVKEKPQPENYLPPVTDRLIEPGVSFLTNAKRSSVFVGMSFYFLSNKQFQKMSGAVELGGGVPFLNDGPEDADLQAFVEDKAVVMNPAAGELENHKQREWVDKVSKFLCKKGKFMVQDAEIGYAALYASTDTYCNPDKDVTHLLPGALPSQSLTQAPSFSSQLDCTQVENSHQQPFRKPAAPPCATQPPSHHSSSSTHQEPPYSDKSAPMSNISQKATSDLSLKRGREEDCEAKEQKVFTVPESLTDSAAPRVKSERLTGEKMDTGLSSSLPESQPFGSKKTLTVKVEEESFSTQHRARSDQLSEMSPDTKLSSVKGESTAEEKPVLLLLDDEEEDVVQIRKPPPSSRAKRRFQHLSDEEEDDPFDFVTKAKTARLVPVPPQKESASGGKTQGEASVSRSTKKQKTAGQRQHSAVVEDVEVIEESMEEDDVRPFDTDGGQGQKRASARKRQTSRSPSPAPASKKGRVGRRNPSPSAATSKKPDSSRDSEEEEEELSAGSVRGRVTPRSPSPKPQTATPKSLSSKAGDADLPKTSESPHRPASCRESTPPASCSPAPPGFQTTRQPRKDEMAVNPKFDKENIDVPAMVIQFENLVVKKQPRPTPMTEDQSGVPRGMMRWNGQIVPNFKNFTKTKHSGADRLPQIIGGRDLVEHCRSESRMMDDWLRDLTQAESQQQQRDREAQQLFDFQPAARGRKARR